MYLNLMGASFCRIVADVVIFNVDVDKFTRLQSLGSDATSLHRRQTLDILFMENTNNSNASKALNKATHLQQTGSLEFLQQAECHMFNSHQ